jgi:NADPH2:quinone reductase
VGAGDVRLEAGSRYCFTEVQRAHRELEERMTTGAPVLLVPEGIE